MFLVSFDLFGQTTLEEYDYLTRDYARAIAMSDDPQKEGYYFENLLNMVDKSGKIMLLYKETQESLTPTATQVHVYDGPKTFSYVFHMMILLKLCLINMQMIFNECLKLVQLLELTMLRS